MGEYNTTKVKVTISLDSEVADKLRLQAYKKYHNSRSTSRLIEDLATGAVELEEPEACSILGHRSESSLKSEADFNKTVEEITAKLSEIKVFWSIKGASFPLTGTDWYFALKEACELKINKEADGINTCWSCQGLNGPLPKYESAGKNFEIYAMMDSNLR